MSLLIIVYGSEILSQTNSDLSLWEQDHSVLTTASWQSVTIGGGGYVTGIYPHPQASDLIYIRTDNGGYYRWQTSQQRWQAITDSLPADWDYAHYSGGEALALDPQNPDLVYIAVGKYSDRPGAIYKSKNRGETWQKLGLTVPMGGDESKRWAGNRLVVSPVNSNLLLFGSRKNGLWRSLDGGITWTQALGLPAPDNSIGVSAIAFAPQSRVHLRPDEQDKDRTTGLPLTSPKLVYASVYDDGVYRSGDGGATWHRIEHSPARVMELAVAQDGIVYSTSDRSPQVSKYVAGTWMNISPKGLFVAEVFNGLSLHPQDVDTLVVSEGEKGRGQLYYSTDRGASWTKKANKLNKTVPWLAGEFFNDHNSAIAFDPQNPRQAWLTDWFSVWHTADLTRREVTWTNRVRGIEQTVLFTLAAPPKGAILLSGLADQDGFYHHDVNDYPEGRLGFVSQRNSLSNLKLNGDRHLNNYFQDTFHIAYCQNQPLNLVRVGGQRWRNVYGGAVSSDGGATWQPWANIPPDKLFMRVAIDPQDPQHYLVTTSEDQPLVTFDHGQSWQGVTGLPNGEAGPWNWNQPLAADGVNGDRFYYFAAGRVYRSDNGGISFEGVAQLPPGEKHILTTVPGVEGEIWLSLDQQGLYHSVDGGESFNKIKAIAEAHLVTVGVSTRAASNNIYIYGIIDQQSGLFVSSNSGQTWQRVNSNSPMPKTTKILQASQRQPGLVFAGTDGRGIYYYQR